MAKQICIFGYIIAIILILSNVRNVSTLNENDEYAAPHRLAALSSSASSLPALPLAAQHHAAAAPAAAAHKNDATPIASTQTNRMKSTAADPLSAIRATRLAQQPPSNAFHDNGGNFMQPPLHNQRVTLNQQIEQHYLVQRDAQNLHQYEQSQLLSNRRIPHESHNTTNRKIQFMNESVKHAMNQRNDTVASAAAAAAVDDDGGSALFDDDGNDDDSKTVQSTEHIQTTERNKHTISLNSTDAQRSIDDEITSMPMTQNARDNGNGSPVDTTFARRLHHTDNIQHNDQRISTKPLRFDDMEYPATEHLHSERSRYLESDLDFDDVLPDTDDKIAWTDDEMDGISQTKLPSSNDDGDGIDDEEESADAAEHRWSIEEPITQPPENQRSQFTDNIYRVAKPNRTRIPKHLTANNAAALMPQALHDIPDKMGSESASDGMNFHHITDLYDQYEWHADDFRRSVSRRCAVDMQRFLAALIKGEEWAVKGKNVF